VEVDGAERLVFYSTWKATESLADKAKISAQDTFPGHVFSSCVFISSITSKPAKDRFGIASFSAVLFAVEFTKKQRHRNPACRI